MIFDQIYFNISDSKEDKILVYLFLMIKDLSLVRDILSKFNQVYKYEKDIKKKHIEYIDIATQLILFIKENNTPILKDNYAPVLKKLLIEKFKEENLDKFIILLTYDYRYQTIFLYSLYLNNIIKNYIEVFGSLNKIDEVLSFNLKNLYANGSYNINYEDIYKNNISEEEFINLSLNIYTQIEDVFSKIIGIKKFKDISKKYLDSISDDYFSIPAYKNFLSKFSN